MFGKGMEEGTPPHRTLENASVEEQKMMPPPLIPSPNADPHARLPPLRRKTSNHVFYNYTQPTSPVPIPHPSSSPNSANAHKYILPEPAASIAYRKNLDVV